MTDRVAQLLSEVLKLSLDVKGRGRASGGNLSADEKRTTSAHQKWTGDRSVADEARITYRCALS